MSKSKGSARSSGLISNSIKIISSCLKTVSSIGGPAEDHKDQVLWAGFDKLVLGPSSFRHVLLLGYSNGFQVIDVDDSSNFRELVSKRDGAVTFSQMQPMPDKSGSSDGYRSSHPLLLVVVSDKTNGTSFAQGAHFVGSTRDNGFEPQPGCSFPTPTSVRFYSLKSDSYVHILRFRSAIYMIRCSPRVIAVALAAQIYCLDATTLESKCSVLTYPMPQGGQGLVGMNIGCGPMAVGPRWLAYASNSPISSNIVRLSPQSLALAPGVNLSSSLGSGNSFARYAMDSSKQFAAGIINLGDIGCRTLCKYYQEILPDGPVSSVYSSSNRKAGRAASAVHPTELDNAGMIVVKDFVSKAIISQFRAHTSPISALCFDPTGTLLVTASVHGNNINVFRILPFHMQNESNPAPYDWTSSHIHLYKLHRGLTTAVIQDICFGHNSQWVAIVSSRGTCHIFTLSPFGGDVGHLPSVSLPWWSTSTCMINQQPCMPPLPVTLSAVSRIKSCKNGWLNTVSNSAVSVSGKSSVPSGAVSAVFHNANYKNIPIVPSKCNTLEHLLVYSSSGHVIQYKLLPSLGIESCDNNFGSGQGPLAHIQDEELQMWAEPVQWWDVCRRSNWQEREDTFSGKTLGKSEASEVVTNTFGCEDNDTIAGKSFNSSVTGNDLDKAHERPNWYLSNAEVQINSGRIAMWHKSQFCIFMMVPSITNESKLANNFGGGEIEIEKIPVRELERRKDLLPVLEHCPSSSSEQLDRVVIVGRNTKFSTSPIHQGKNAFMDGVGSGDVKYSSPRVEGFSEKERTENLHDQTSEVGRHAPIGSHSMETQIYCGLAKYSTATTCFTKDLESEKEGIATSIGGDGCIVNGLSSLDSNFISVGGSMTTGAFSSGNCLDDDESNIISANNSALGLNVHVETENKVSQDLLYFAQFFHEDHCKISELNDCCGVTEVVNAEGSGSNCERERLDEDVDNDEMLAGIFAFSEEG